MIDHECRANELRSAVCKMLSATGTEQINVIALTAKAALQRDNELLDSLPAPQDRTDPTPQEQLIRQWRSNAVDADRLVARFDAEFDQAGNSFAFLKEARVWRTCADQLEGLVAAPARAHHEETMNEPHVEPCDVCEMGLGTHPWKSKQGKPLNVICNACLDNEVRYDPRGIRDPHPAAAPDAGEQQESAKTMTEEHHAKNDACADARRAEPVRSDARRAVDDCAADAPTDRGAALPEPVDREGAASGLYGTGDRETSGRVERARLADRSSIVAPAAHEEIPASDFGLGPEMQPVVDELRRRMNAAGATDSSHVAAVVTRLMPFVQHTDACVGARSRSACECGAAKAMEDAKNIATALSTADLEAAPARAHQEEQAAYVKVLDTGPVLDLVSPTDVQHALGAEETAMKVPKVVYQGGLTDREHAIIEAHRWQLAHAAENTPTPSDAYTVISGLLSLLPFQELSAAIAKAEGR